MPCKSSDCLANAIDHAQGDHRLLTDVDLWLVTGRPAGRISISVTKVAAHILLLLAPGIVGSIGEADASDQFHQLHPSSGSEMLLAGSMGNHSLNCRHRRLLMLPFLAAGQTDRSDSEIPSRTRALRYGSTCRRGWSALAQLLGAAQVNNLTKHQGKLGAAQVNN